MAVRSVQCTINWASREKKQPAADSVFLRTLSQVVNFDFNQMFLWLCFYHVLVKLDWVGGGGGGCLTCSLFQLLSVFMPVQLNLYLTLCNLAITGHFLLIKYVNYFAFVYI